MKNLECVYHMLGCTTSTHIVVSCRPHDTCALLKLKLVKLSRDLKCLLDIYLDDISERDNDCFSMESLHKPKVVTVAIFLGYVTF